MIYDESAKQPYIHFYRKEDNKVVDPILINMAPFKFIYDELVRRGFYDSFVREYGHPLKKNARTEGEL